ncbi:MAG: hypothetical protein HUU46_02380 [Candidatus Hydrogenedentes bacterium]|nr:hypothetical protein [Candidatus Hydrogenedentota bacterium]
MKDALLTALRFPFFCASRCEMLRFNAEWRYFVCGIVATWIVGLGRWWDDGGANLFQKLGLGSVVYVFVLAFFLWITLLPMRPNDWSYPRVLVCVTFTALPGIVYAIPVERMMTSAVAARVNLGFLAFVAGWRVALLMFFARRLGKLTWPRTLVGSLFPLVFVVTLVSATVKLNMSLLRDMAGIKNFNDEQLVVEAAANVVSEVSNPLFLPLMIAYVTLAIISLYRAKRVTTPRESERSV